MISKCGLGASRLSISSCSRPSHRHRHAFELKQPKLPEGIWEVTAWEVPVYFGFRQQSREVTSVVGLLDLDEFVGAIDRRQLDVSTAVDEMRRQRRFLDLNLRSSREPQGAWIDFRPRDCGSSRPFPLPAGPVVTVPARASGL